jgi:hypothetical protein
VFGSCASFGSRQLQPKFYEHDNIGPVKLNIIREREDYKPEIPFRFNTKNKGVDLICNINRMLRTKLSIVVRYESVQHVTPYYLVNYANGSIDLLDWKVTLPLV